MKSIIVLLTLFCLCQGKKEPPKPPKPPKVTGCPMGWIAFRKTGRCFYISPGADTYENATKSCESMKSELVPLITCNEQIDFRDLLISHRGKCRKTKGRNCLEFWIGIHNLTGGKWQTSKGFEIDKKSRCQHWAKHYPLETGGQCVKMSFKGNLKRGAWKNTKCTNKLKYVCITCPHDFYYVPEVNECLFVNVKPVNWSVAQQSCATFKKGAQLLTIQDTVKQEAVTRYIKSVMASNEPDTCLYREWAEGGKLVWLGGQTADPDDCKTPYVWKPVGAPPIPFTYNNWIPGKPNCGFVGENCVMLTTNPHFNYRWEDLWCDSPLCFICEL